MTDQSLFAIGNRPNTLWPRSYNRRIRRPLIDVYTGGTYEDGSAGERGQAGILQVGPKKVANGEINEPTGRVLRSEPRLLHPDEHDHFFFAVATLDHDWRPAW